MANKQKYLIIQPHSDDALLCCASFIFNEDSDCEILTVENNAKRVAEDERLYEFLGVKYDHLDTKFDDQSYYGYHKQFKEVTLDDALPFLYEMFGQEVMDDTADQIKKYIRKWKKKNPDGVIIGPWGVGHPMHLFVQYVIETVDRSAVFYRDFPHSYKRRSKSQVEKWQGKFALVASHPVEKFANEKWAIAKKFYKSQSGFFWFEQGYIQKNLPEQFYMLSE